MGFKDFFIKPEEERQENVKPQQKVEQELITQVQPQVFIKNQEVTAEVDEAGLRHLWEVPASRNLPGPDLLEVKNFAESLKATGALDIKMKREVQNIMLKIFYDPSIQDPINVSHSIEEVAYVSNKVFILQANPCRIFKEIDITCPGEEFRQRGEWVFNTPEYAEYVKILTACMDSISK